MPSLLPIHLNGSNRTCNARCNGKSKNTIKSQACFVKYWKWNKTHQESAGPNQTQMGMSDQTHDICRHPKCARMQMQGSVPNQSLIPICLSLLEGIGTNIEKKRFKCASPYQKLMNLWIITQANNQEQGAMPNISLTPKLLLFFLGGGCQI